MAKHASPSAHLQVVESPKSVAVQIPLPVLGALVDGKSALFDLCVSVGQQVLGVLMEHDRDTCCGPKGKQDPERKAVRAGSTRSEVTLGGRRIQVRRLRARGAAGELALPSFVFAADRDPLDRHTLEAIACGVSTRKYAAEPRAALRGGGAEHLEERRLAAIRGAVPEADDGVAYQAASRRGPPGPGDRRDRVSGPHDPDRAGDRQRRAEARSRPARGHDREQPGGASAAPRSARAGSRPRARTWSSSSTGRRRSGPRSGRPSIGWGSCSAARSTSGGTSSRTCPRRSTPACTRSWSRPGTAPTRSWRSVVCGDSPTRSRPSIPAPRRRSAKASRRRSRSSAWGSRARSTGRCGARTRSENLNGSVADYTRNVKRWRGGSMLVRWVSASVLEASRRFRRVRGLSRPRCPRSRTAEDRRRTGRRHPPSGRVVESLNSEPPFSKFNTERDIAGARRRG